MSERAGEEPFGSGKYDVLESLDAALQQLEQQNSGDTANRNDEDTDSRGDVASSEPISGDETRATSELTGDDVTDFKHVEVGLQETAGEEPERFIPDPEVTRESSRLEKQTTLDDPQLPISHRMHRFTLYESASKYYITGSDITDKQFKILKIDRTAPPGQLSIFEDSTRYTKKEVQQMLTAIDDGNKATGGLRVRCNFWGILGFIRFTEAYYMLLITKRQQVAMIGGHYIYQIDGTELIPLTTGASTRFARDRNPEEARFLSILNNLDLTRSFYFSYSYNITRTLQHNITSQRVAINAGRERPAHDYNDMFVWNHHLLNPAVSSLKNAYEWCLPIIHGFIDQAALDVFGRTVYVTIIGRRSRFFAGARFLKRGTNDLGYVANDVETEQIVSELRTTSFHAPGPRLFSSPTYTSYVHHRGSIPLYWTQDNSGVTPKPDIDLNLTDPFYQPAALHFDNLFERYGCPIYVLNLIKARERTPRESKLLHEFQNAIAYLNQFLPDGKKIDYKAFDMSRASKTRGGDVIGNLETIAEDIVRKTGFFHNGNFEEDLPRVQNGVARTNCIDCLDRTNAAQFVIGKKAFGHQLKALGVISTVDLEYDSDAVNIFTHMFHDHGDTIAVQYGGSHLVNTMATYRKINHWQSHSRDMVESFKRYYHNSFLDAQRQEAYNLFLGNYIWAQGQPMLWDLSTDYYLHHTDPRAWLDRTRRSYIQWYTPEFLEQRTIPPPPERYKEQLVKGPISEFDDYWLEYYRPLVVSSFLKVYAYRINSTNRYLPERPRKDSKFDFSPFVPRLDPNRPSPDSPEKKPPRKGVKIVDPNSENDAPRANAKPDTRFAPAQPSILREPTAEGDFVTRKPENEPKPADKALMTQWTLNQFHHNSLNPSVTRDQEGEYSYYVSHPLNLPLVVSSELPSDTNLMYVDYVNSGKGDEEAGEIAAPWDTEENIPYFQDFLQVEEDPLTVREEDWDKKRYRAFQQWLKGKSLFKQSKVDPEYKP
ncbi:phosphatidylinositol-3,5-bisphosphate 5-phosphatase [Zalaria obscura]|uniref:Phosphatidylinositol-3,5-bisphosphate 5-phosphatase n=1 Tax=Zalaria obscura TaxID=2024903 RepID=A0ACC3SDJ4_9PEZI